MVRRVRQPLPSASPTALCGTCTQAQGVKWSEDVVEVNETSGKKSSKSENARAGARHGARAGAQDAPQQRQDDSAKAHAPLVVHASVHSRDGPACSPPRPAASHTRMRGAPWLCAECCIFHRRRKFGDWSDDDDSDVEGCADGCDDQQAGGAMQGRQPSQAADAAQAQHPPLPA